MLHSAPFPVRHCRASKDCHPVQFLLVIVEENEVTERVGAHPTPMRRVTGQHRAEQRRASRTGRHPDQSDDVKLAETWFALTHATQNRAGAVGQSRFRCRSAGHATAHRGGSRSTANDVDSNHEPLSFKDLYHGEKGRIRTFYPLIMSQLLYPNELLFRASKTSRPLDTRRAMVSVGAPNRHPEPDSLCGEG